MGLSEADSSWHPDRFKKLLAGELQLAIKQPHRLGDLLNSCSLDSWRQGSLLRCLVA